MIMSYEEIAKELDEKEQAKKTQKENTVTVKTPRNQKVKSVKIGKTSVKIEFQ